jgi:serine/threonine-protein kinase
MDVTIAALSRTGPVRSNNEDLAAWWSPQGEVERSSKGVVALLADGVGGHGNGEVASRMACELAIKEFQAAQATRSVNATLWQMFNQANLGVYNASMENARLPEEGRMASTMSACLFRNDQVAIGHVGDCRVYHVRDGTIKCLTTDHTFVAFHQKMGLFAGHYIDRNSPLRGGLTRSIGKDPIVMIDFIYQTVKPGDIVILCTDGVHTNFEDREVLSLIVRQSPAETASNIIGLCESRGAEDNSTVVVCRVDSVRTVNYFRGIAVVQEKKQTMSNDVTTNDVLDDRFEILDTISRSGMATIFKAFDREASRQVALKVPLMQFESDPAFFDRFKREEEIGRMLDHPNILKVIPVDPAKRSRPYMVMELLKGITLDAYMQQNRPVPLGKALDIARETCGALAHMHSKEIVHRDLKPQNIMLCEDGTLRIIDFGIAKSAQMRRLTFAGFSPAMGTPDYMAPEQVEGKRGDARSDIYSLGAILYEMVTGQVPFEGANPFLVMHARVVGDPVAPRVRNKDMSPELEEIILHAMARDPGDRYQDAEAFLKDLTHPNQVQLTGRSDRLVVPKLSSVHQKKALKVGLLVLVPIVIFGAIFLMSRNGNGPTTAPRSQGTQKSK